MRWKINSLRGRNAARCLTVGLPLSCLFAPLSLFAQSVSGPDVARIQIVENPAPTSQAERLRVVPEKVLRIGNVAGREDTNLAVILSARFLSDGNVAVSDLYDNRIRIFDGRHGELIRSIGREGGGPGEFAAAPTIAPTSDGGIWAWDPGSRRLSLFTLDGDLESEVVFSPSQLMGIPLSRTLNAWRVASPGVILSIIRETRKHGSVWATTRRLAVIDRNNQHPVYIGEALTLEHVTEGDAFLVDPFSSSSVVAIADDKVYVGQPGLWQLNIYHMDGRLSRIVRSPIPRRQITAELRSAVHLQMAESYSDEPILGRLLDRLEHQDSTSAMSAIMISSNDEIWIARWSLSIIGEDVTYDIFGKHGEWLRSLTVPSELGEVIDVAEDKILAIWRDRFNVPYLRVYPLVVQ